MRIELKISLALLGISSSLMALYYFGQRPQLLREFEQLQHQKAENNAWRCREAILTEVDAVAKQTQDWASWDDTYQFVQDGNEEYKTTNLTENLFDTTHFDLIVYFNLKGNTVYTRTKLPSGKVTSQTDGIDFAEIKRPLIQAMGQKDSLKWRVTGISRVNGTPAALCARPILDSSQHKSYKGILLVARYLTKEVIQEMSSKQRVPMTLLSSDKAKELPEFTEAQDALKSRDTWAPWPRVGIVGMGLTTLPSFGNGTNHYVRVETFPDILMQGNDSVQVTSTNLLIVIALAALASIILVNLMVSMPLRRFAHQIQVQDTEGVNRLSPDLERRRDEIGIVAGAYSELMERLESANSKLRYASHESGMADLAREVLHNTGNVLNSLTVSVRQCTEIVQHAHPVGLKKAVDLLRENESNLQTFLTFDPKGTRLLPYLEAMVEKYGKDLADLEAEHKQLGVSARHMSDLINSHRSLAHKKSERHTFRVSRVVREASAMLDASLQRHGITLVLDVDDQLYASGDPTKLLQILTNLISNAKDAVKSCARSERAITIKSISDPDGVRLSVADNGRGINPENLTKIFAQGFSMRPNGTGIGLHFCANSCKGMGWTLSAHSEGDGSGATFTIFVPKELMQENAA